MENTVSFRMKRRNASDSSREQIYTKEQIRRVIIQSKSPQISIKRMYIISLPFCSVLQPNCQSLCFFSISSSLTPRDETHQTIQFRSFEIFIGTTSQRVANIYEHRKREIDERVKYWTPEEKHGTTDLNHHLVNNPVERTAAAFPTPPPNKPP